MVPDTTKEVTTKLTFAKIVRGRNKPDSEPSAVVKPSVDPVPASPMPDELIKCVERMALNSASVAVLSHEQVERLDQVMNENITIIGRGNFPTINVKLRNFVTVVNEKLSRELETPVNNIRLNGGAASYVLTKPCHKSYTYNDLDVIFPVHLAQGRHFDRVKTAVLNSLLDLLPEGVKRNRISTCSLKEAYVSKMVKVNNEGDCWSLISLGNSRGPNNVELKFVDSMKRPFEFSVDSFQIVLDSLLAWYKRSECVNEAKPYPSVVGESVYGDFKEALHHLHNKMIATRNPEEIRGGGLLKYCNLLVKNYKPASPENIKMMERYMCSRFFIDFPNINQQRSKLEMYLWNHFIGEEEEALRYRFLNLLKSVVEESTVCLMHHERRQTLCLIEELACEVYYNSSAATMGCNIPQGFYHPPQPQGPAGYVYPSTAQGGYYYGDSHGRIYNSGTHHTATVPIHNHSRFSMYGYDRRGHPPALYSHHTALGTTPA